MNSFKVTAVGNLAKNPELEVKGETTYTRFCLVGNDYAGKDEQGNAREIVTSIYFVAFEGTGRSDRKERPQRRPVDRAGANRRQQLDRQGRREAIRPFLRRAERFDSVLPAKPSARNSPAGRIRRSARSNPKPIPAFPVIRSMKGIPAMHHPRIEQSTLVTRCASRPDARCSRSAPRSCPGLKPHPS